VLHNWSFVRHTVSEFFDPQRSGSLHIFCQSYYFQFVQILQWKEKIGGQSKWRVVWRGKSLTQLGLLRSPNFCFFALIGSLFTDNANSPRLSRSFLDTQIFQSTVWVTSFILADNLHFWGEMFGIFADVCLWLKQPTGAHFMKLVLAWKFS